MCLHNEAVDEDMEQFVYHKNTLHVILINIK